MRRAPRPAAGQAGARSRSETAEAVLAQLREAPASTITALTQATGFSRPTVVSVLEDLARAGIVHEAQAEDQGVGRPAGAWSLRRDAGLVVGVDILPASILVAVASVGYEVLTAARHPLSSDSARGRLDQVLAALRSTLEPVADRGPVHHVAVSTTGRVDDAGTLHECDLVPQWRGLPLADRLSRALDAGVSVENDINMAAVGEFETRRQDGRLAPDGDLLFVQLARGLHTGLVLRGSLHRGHHWNAGEIADVLDLRTDHRVEADEDWVRRATLSIASVAAVVDPDAIVISAPSPASRATVSRLARRVSGLRRPGSPTFATEAADLGWAASTVGALHLALRRADEELTGTDSPRPAALTHLSRIRAALTKGPHSTMLPSPSPGRTRTLRVGVVGVGARSRFTLAAERPENNGLITAVCDPHPLVGERVRDRLEREPDSVAITSTVAELIDTGIDVAFVTSPDDTHAEVTCALLEAGIPVYLEKPLAIDLDDATRILRTAHETGTRLYVGHNMRHMNVVRSMREIIRDGRIGEVKAIWCRHFVGHGGDFYFKDWHADRSRVGSLLLQKAAHDIDVMHWLAGSSTTEVVAMGGLTLYDRVADRADNSDRLMSQWFSTEHWPPLEQRGLNPVIDVEDLSMVLMRMESGVMASYQQCHYTPDYWRNYTVIGTQGRIENFGDGEGGVIRLWRSRSDYSPEGDESLPILGDAGGHGDADVLTIGEFMRFAREGGPTDTSPLGAWQAVAAGIQAADSLRHGSSPRRVPELDRELIDYFIHHQHKQD